MAPDEAGGLTISLSLGRTIDRVLGSLRRALTDEFVTQDRIRVRRFPFGPRHDFTVVDDGEVTSVMPPLGSSQYQGTDRSGTRRTRTRRHSRYSSARRSGGTGLVLERQA